MPAQLDFADLDQPVLPEGLILRAGLLDADAQRRLWAALQGVLAAAPPAPNRTKGGGYTSAAMTNCGPVGWWSDAKGYRYTPTNPVTGTPWPPFPSEFIALIQRVMEDSPWPRFSPDACLINHYVADARMGLHQDKDEADFTQPIVTVSLGDTADFLIGGAARSDKAAAFKVRSGDVLLMGGPARMRFHGVRKIYPGTSPLLKSMKSEIMGFPGGRFSLTFRKAL